MDGDDGKVLKGNPVLDTTATDSSAVGSYPIALALGDLAADNYAFTSADSTLEVTQAPLTVSADDQARLYGQDNPTLTLTYNGFVNGEDPSALDEAPIASTLAQNDSPVGTYAISVTGGLSGNYAFTLVPGHLAVNKATVIATADDQSRVYGLSNPTLTITYSGFANKEDATVLGTLPIADTAANAGSSVGTYPITLCGGNDHNYDITLVSGNLNVTKAALTAQADDQTRVYGTDNLPLTISYSGFANNDSATTLALAPVAGTLATAQSPVGSYPITVAAGSDNNYDITVLPGTLTVTPAALTVMAKSETRTYGTINPTFTGTH